MYPKQLTKYPLRYKYPYVIDPDGERHLNSALWETGNRPSLNPAGSCVLRWPYSEKKIIILTLLLIFSIKNKIRGTITVSSI